MPDSIVLVITQATPEYAKQIVAFLNAVGGETSYLTFGLNEFPLSEKEEEQFIAECLTKNTSLMLIGLVGNEVVSQLFIDVSSQPRLAHIGTIGVSVSKRFWGQSIGMRMLIAAIDWAKKQRMAKLQLQVRSDNNAAIALYKKLGFVIEGTITRSIKIDNIYYDEYTMGLTL